MRALATRAVIFVVLVGGFFLSAFSVPGIIERFSRRLPENYRYIAMDALRRGDAGRAAEICRRRINQFHYDFEAHYLLAEALARRQEYLEAAETLKSVIRKVPAARARKVNATGYDEAHTLLLLSRYLWEAGKYFEAGEITRAAIDAGSTTIREEQDARLDNLPPDPEAVLAIAQVAFKTRNRLLYDTARQSLTTSSQSLAVRAGVLHSRWLEFVDGDSTSAARTLNVLCEQYPDEPLAQLAAAHFFERQNATSESQRLVRETMSTTGSRPIPITAFRLPEGANLTTFSISLGRNGTAAAEVSTGVFRVTSLLMSLKASRALGMTPLVILRVNGTEATRLYVDGPFPREIDLPLWPEGAPKAVSLELEFYNDAYDPVTRADRNVQFFDMLLH